MKRASDAPVRPIWSFSYAKHRNVKFAKAAPEGAGDVRTWTAIDADSELIVSWHVGDRSQHTGISFMGDLKARLANRVQLTTDGHKAYLKAVDAVDFDADTQCLLRFSDRLRWSWSLQPAQVHWRDQADHHGQPCPDLTNTPFAERQNLTMSMRRFTRLTNAFSKKFESHWHALALYFVFYNFAASIRRLA